jgi:DNA modification methylase
VIRKKASKRLVRPRAGDLRDFRPLAEGKNPNRHTQQGLGQLEAAMDRQGYVAPMTAARNGAILDGNARLEKSATKFDGVAPLVIRHDGSRPVIMVRTDIADEDDPLARDIIVSANRVAQVDLDLDLNVLKSFAADGLNLAPFEFPADMLQAITGVAEGHTDPDEVPELRPTSIKLGDVFELGAHRLMCWDCTDAEMVDRLMGGVRAGLMNTDPPYGVDYENDSRPNPGVAKPRVAKPRVANDAALVNSDSLGKFLTEAFRAAKKSALAQNAAWYAWFGNMNQNGTFIAAAAAAVVLHRQIIWVKPVLLLGRGQYHWKHEPCFMGWVDGHQPPDYGLGQGERTQTTIWEIDGVNHAERKEFNHSTPKPVGLFTIPIVKHLRAGEACYEPFAGSGPQFIAAEQHRVRCFGLELEPRFCDVIIRRWETFTGQTATKVGEVAKPRLKKRGAA